MLHDGNEARRSAKQYILSLLPTSQKTHCTYITKANHFNNVKRST